MGKKKEWPSDWMQKLPLVLLQVNERSDFHSSHHGQREPLPTFRFLSWFYYFRVLLIMRLIILLPPADLSPSNQLISHYSMKTWNKMKGYSHLTRFNSVYKRQLTRCAILMWIKWPNHHTFTYSSHVESCDSLTDRLSRWMIPVVAVRFTETEEIHEGRSWKYID